MFKKKKKLDLMKISLPLTFSRDEEFI